MNLSQMIRPALVAGLVALPLAGCSSGASQFNPINPAAQSRQAANRYNAQVVAIPNAAKFLSEAERRGTGHNVVGMASSSKCSQNVYIYTSEAVTGDLDVFCEDTAGSAQNALVSQTGGLAGWGLAVSPVKMPVPISPCTQGASQELLAVGTNSGTVDIYCNLSGGGYTKLNVAPLTLAQGDAYGICWDQSGGIYTTQWPYNTIAHFTNGQLVTGGAPTILTPNVNVVEYHVACDFDKLLIKKKPKGENYLMAYGFDANFNVNVTNVNTSTGAETVEQTIGNYASATGFPGGLAIDKKDDLAVNNQYGTLYYFRPELWNRPPLGTCTWGYNPNDFTNIAFDDAQNEVWASNINVINGAFTTYAQSNRFPFSNRGGSCSPGKSGYQTAYPLAGEYEDLGVAVWPNGGV